MLKLASLSFTAALLASVSTVAPASAAEVALTTPTTAAVLHEGAIDMVVYTVERAAGTEVVATYAEQGDETMQGRRLSMILAAGDDLKMGLPGHPKLVFRFAHDGARILVQAAPTGMMLASVAAR